MIYETPEENEELINCGGYCDVSAKCLHIRKYPESPGKCGDIAAWTNKVARHEILHAFMYESGLWSNGMCLDEESWAMNEEMIDWFAIQSSKIFKAFKAAGVL